MEIPADSSAGNAHNKKGQNFRKSDFVIKPKPVDTFAQIDNFKVTAHKKDVASHGASKVSAHMPPGNLMPMTSGTDVQFFSQQRDFNMINHGSWQQSSAYLPKPDIHHTSVPQSNFHNAGSASTFGMVMPPNSTMVHDQNVHLPNFIPGQVFVPPVYPYNEVPHHLVPHTFLPNNGGAMAFNAQPTDFNAWQGKPRSNSGYQDLKGAQHGPSDTTHLNASLAKPRSNSGHIDSGNIQHGFQEFQGTPFVHTQSTNFNMSQAKPESNSAYPMLYGASSPRPKSNSFGVSNENLQFSPITPVSNLNPPSDMLGMNIFTQVSHPQLISSTKIETHAVGLPNMQAPTPSNSISMHSSYMTSSSKDSDFQEFTSFNGTPNLPSATEYHPSVISSSVQMQAQATTNELSEEEDFGDFSSFATSSSRNVISSSSGSSAFVANSPQPLPNKLKQTEKTSMDGKRVNIVVKNDDNSFMKLPARQQKTTSNATTADVFPIPKPVRKAAGSNSIAEALTYAANQLSIVKPPPEEEVKDFTILQEVINATDSSRWSPVVKNTESFDLPDTPTKLNQMFPKCTPKRLSPEDLHQVSHKVVPSHSANQPELVDDEFGAFADVTRITSNNVQQSSAQKTQNLPSRAAPPQEQPAQRSHAADWSAFKALEELRHVDDTDLGDFSVFGTKLSGGANEWTTHENVSQKLPVLPVASSLDPGNLIDSGPYDLLPASQTKIIETTGDDDWAEFADVQEVNQIPKMPPSGVNFLTTVASGGTISTNSSSELSSIPGAFHIENSKTTDDRKDDSDSDWSFKDNISVQDENKLDIISKSSSHSDLSGLEFKTAPGISKELSSLDINTQVTSSNTRSVTSKVQESEWDAFASFDVNTSENLWTSNAAAGNLGEKSATGVSATLQPPHTHEISFSMTGGQTKNTSLPKDSHGSFVSLSPAVIDDEWGEFGKPIENKVVYEAIVQQKSSIFDISLYESSLKNTDALQKENLKSPANLDDEWGDFGKPDQREIVDEAPCEQKSSVRDINIYQSSLGNSDTFSKDNLELPPSLDDEWGDFGRLNQTEATNLSAVEQKSSVSNNNFYQSSLEKSDGLRRKNSPPSLDHEWGDFRKPEEPESSHVAAKNQQLSSPYNCELSRSEPVLREKEASLSPLAFSPPPLTDEDFSPPMKSAKARSDWFFGNEEESSEEAYVRKEVTLSSKNNESIKNAAATGENGLHAFKADKLPSQFSNFSTDPEDIYKHPDVPNSLEEDSDHEFGIFSAKPIDSDDEGFDFKPVVRFEETENVGEKILQLNQSELSSKTTEILNECMAEEEFTAFPGQSHAGGSSSTAEQNPVVPKEDEDEPKSSQINNNMLVDADNWGFTLPAVSNQHTGPTEDLQRPVQEDTSRETKADEGWGFTSANENDDDWTFKSPLRSPVSSPTSPASPAPFVKPSLKEPTIEDNDGFGDFGDFHEDTASGTVKSDDGGDFEQFGDFGSQDVASIERKNVGAASDDEFGDFDNTRAFVSADQSSKPTHDAAEFGEFDDKQLSSLTSEFVRIPDEKMAVILNSLFPSNVQPNPLASRLSLLDSLRESSLWSSLGDLDLSVSLQLQWKDSALNTNLLSSLHIPKDAQLSMSHGLAPVVIHSKGSDIVSVQTSSNQENGRRTAKVIIREKAANPDVQ